MLKRSDAYENYNYSQSYLTDIFKLLIDYHEEGTDRYQLDT